MKLWHVYNSMNLSDAKLKDVRHKIAEFGADPSLDSKRKLIEALEFYKTCLQMTIKDIENLKMRGVKNTEYIDNVST